MMQRQREPCYVACRLHAVNEIDSKRKRASIVFRVHLIFRPRKEALQFLPEQGRRVNSAEDDWRELERLQALPTLGVKNGKLEFTEPTEFFRVSDATSVYDDANKVEEIWFPPLDGDDREREGSIAVLTYLIRADGQLDRNFEEYPFDKHELCVKLFLPKKHKDKMYELHCDPNMRVTSERIKAKEEGGQGILELTPEAEESLSEWEIIPDKTELFRNENATGEQSGITMRIGIRRIPQHYVTKFLVRPGEIATLACLSTFIPSIDIGTRLTLTSTILLSLIGINNTSSDSLPALHYSTALDKYHKACHYLVYGVIMHNVIFFLYAFRCSKSCAAEPTTDTAAGTVDPTMATACDANADAPCAAVAATVASRWCSMCGYNIVVDYWILLDLDDFVMSFIFAYWIYWNRKWFATRVGATPTPAPPPPKDWYYRDDEGTVQGPFDEATIAKWYSAGYLPAQLIMREAEQPDTAYKSLADLTQAGGGKPPFVRALRLRAKYEAELVALVKGALDRLSSRV